ncbi:nucleotidyltransferase [Pectobacterium polaris]|uniref:CBASS oligonucleotide cyclase n=1 Tax=Pectobacterium polaris TaxID=2042057 RepID=UPI001CF2C09F|nr:CBASS oligonucleotide cyclase [Pectobacterium polaris]MCA6942816.1 nucleotidyltransferase [Pectobacterium polaris]MCA6957923.1 nucleotidyltransferase [Pectobacterium polaris]
MPLNNTQIRYYDSNVLRLPKDKRETYNAQVDRLIGALRKALKEQDKITIKRVVKAGSFAKHTILRKSSDNPVDVDVVFYISGKKVAEESFASLSEKIYEALLKVYPSKAVEDFQIQRKAATVSFVGTGLDVDIVPVIENPDKEGYGWQFDRFDGSKTETCAPCQIKFVKDRKDQDSDFRTLVRLAKRWRTNMECPLKSFHIELIMAHVLEINGKEGSLEKRFRDFLLYIADSGLQEVITFPENSTVPVFTDPVVILDPVCDTNNVASRITEDERKEIVRIADECWATAVFASEEDDYDIWKELFGRSFKVEEAV